MRVVFHSKARERKVVLQKPLQWKVTIEAEGESSLTFLVISPIPTDFACSFQVSDRKFAVDGLWPKMQMQERDLEGLLWL